MKSSVRKTWLLLLCILANFVCSVFVHQIAESSEHVLSLGSFSIPLSSIQGVLTGLRSLFCTVMLFIDYSIGLVIALIIISLNLTSSLIDILCKRSLAPLPAILSSLISVLTLFIVYKFYKRAAVSSQTDFITGLYNRRKFSEDLDNKILQGKPFFLASLEIEGFKHINDTYGIQMGDYILQKTAERLIRSAGKRERIFKITGATFMLFFEDERTARSIIEELIKPEHFTLPLKKGELTATAPGATVFMAAGVAAFPQDATDGTSLITKADTALNAAKKTEQKKLCFFSSDLENSEAQQREAENLIREALEHNWFYLVYQPQYTLSDHKLRGFETLIRCRRSDGTVISPAAFIPAAEKSNLILKIDDYVLQRAMTEFKPVIEEKPGTFMISINVSAKNIGSADFAERVTTMLKNTGFPANRLEIEITEYSLADSMEITIANILNLRNVGVKVALDDFGTGYTSIAQLMKLPINLLKIDKSLIDDIESNQNIRDLVDSVIYMGHIMNCEVISEGVENEHQIGVLKEHKCDFVQGFVWGKPLSFEDAVKLC
ncbi:MAG: bifunctional diguanylate cyclase/phosphodiesterase [Treponema sp.]|nr:bifunctional diguanylate cyclase/phosphodiesterase [Treponema sp.]